MALLNGNQSIDELLQSDNFKKGLKNAEIVIQYINKKYISLNDADYTSYAHHLNNVLTMLVQRMKNSNPLFSTLYQREHFAGSYADGLKIGKPTEYDMNLIIKLPVDYTKLQFEPGTPSFVKINGKEAFANISGAPLSPDFLRWVDEEGYLLQTKFREWMESVLTKVFLTLPLADYSDPNTRVLKDEASSSEGEYKIKHKKSGPAMTLKVTTPDGCLLDVDLVPAFQFGQSVWPPPPVAALPEICKKKSWMVVPKPKRIKEGETLDINDAREWRMSFLDQERELLSGSGTVKPTIKLLKKLRDSSQIKLSSYAIKTVALFEMKNQSSEFWRNRQIYLFLFMLHRLTEQIRTGHIPFYWDERDDLLKLEKRVHENVSNRLANIFKDIVKVIDKNPYIIAEKLLNPDECKDVEDNCKIPTAEKSRPSVALAINEAITQDETDGGAGSSGGSSSGGVITPNQIYCKLEEIAFGQKQMPQQILRAIFSGREPLQGAHTNHEECQKKQAELEERIADLEDKVNLMMRQIKSLTQGA
ncbi:uncharacterized protein LOC117653494 [Thrips palmi]|uniref:Uncharacterized protein LOC117653494 n=1 Tax=Thrips palmi TaxID=161013 RepID=A0A6P9AAE6_THRPL|nr:uncharacterized protein LOC117653494 [Thrips palmi]